MKWSFPNRIVKRRWWPILLGGGICFLFLVSEGMTQAIIATGRPEGTVEFGFEREGLETFSEGRSDFAFRQRRFDERVGFRGNAYIFDPRFVTMNYGTAFGFVQDRLTSGAARSGGKGKLLGYDLGWALLSGKNISSTLFTNRVENVSTREFGGTSETFSKSTGAVVNLRSLFIPSTVSYRKELSKDESRFGITASRRAQLRSILSYDGRDHWGPHDVGLGYEFAKEGDQLSHGLTSRSHSASLSHRFNFSEDAPKRLSSMLNYRRRLGGLEFSSLNFNEDFSVQHSNSLSTGYHYYLARFGGAAASRTTSQTGLASLQYRLYESLTTGLSLHGTHTGLSGGRQVSYGPRLDLGYQKRLRGNGKLLASLDSSYEIQDSLLAAGVIPVFREEHTPRIGIPFQLRRPLAIPESILVSGETGTILFREGLDYVVRLFGNFAEMDLLASGRIRDGETVLVDYQVRIPASIKFSTLLTSFNVGPDFGWVSFHYGYSRQTQNLLSGSEDGFLDVLRTHAAGLQFRWSGPRFQGSLSNEYRSQDSRLSPSRSLQFGQSFSFMALRSFTLGINFDESLSHYKLPERRTANGTGRLTAAWTPWPAVSLEGFFSARFWKDSLSEGENFRDAGLRLNWTPSAFVMTLVFDRNFRKRNGTHLQGSRLFLNVVRRF